MKDYYGVDWYRFFQLCLPAGSLCCDEGDTCHGGSNEYLLQQMLEKQPEYNTS